MNTVTLFARYKAFINHKWNIGCKTYTAQELNRAVGDYETSSSWKRMNNNPYYTTRTYQTSLKQLGCIRMIRRGHWEILGPIPQWFGSFHIAALSSRCALQSLERSSIYWKSLPQEHKVNPWGTKTTKPTQDITRRIHNILITKGSNLLPIKALTGTLCILTDRYGQAIKPLYWEGFQSDGVEISEEMAWLLCSVIHMETKSLSELLTAAENKTMESLAPAPAQPAPTKAYTQEDINAMLQTVQEAVTKAVAAVLQSTRK